MADFSPGSMYVDVPQTGVAVRRIQSDMRFICTRMVPKMLVKKPSGLYTVVSMADLNRDEMEARGPSGQARKGAWGTSKQMFDTDARSLGFDLNDAAAAASDVETNPETMIPRVLGYKALLHMERRMAAKFFAGGTWYRTVTGAVADNAGTATAKNRLYFSDAAADPIEALSDEIRILSLLTGADPLDMGLAMGGRLWHKLRNHAKVKSQIVGLAGGAIGNAIIGMARQAELPELARLLGIKACFVSSAIFNAALENVAADNQPIVPENDALLFVNPYAGEENADAGLTLESDKPAAFARAVWNGVAGPEGVQIRKFRDEKAGPGGSWSSVIDVYQGFVTVTAECGVRFTGMAL